MSDGWAKRQRDQTARNVYEWPVWMRREAGITNPEDNLTNALLRERAADQAAIRLADEILDAVAAWANGGDVQAILDACKAFADGSVAAIQRAKTQPTTTTERDRGEG